MEQLDIPQLIGEVTEYDKKLGIKEFNLPVIC